MKENAQICNSRKKRKMQKHLRNIRAYAIRVTIMVVFINIIVMLGDHASLIFAQANENAPFKDIEVNVYDGFLKEMEANAKQEGEAAMKGEQARYNIPGADSDFLLLVNKKNPLSESYEIELKPFVSNKTQVAEGIYDDLAAMLKQAEREGQDIWLGSAYRSWERQNELLDEDINEMIRGGASYSEAYFEVSRETMPPGCSEHQTGLAVDLVAKDYQMLDAGQEQTSQNQWLRENCHKYGFILRYPKDKEDMTGIAYESWHFRYVGVEAATYIMENELTLEEYIKEIEESKAVYTGGRVIYEVVW